MYYIKYIRFEKRVCLKRKFLYFKIINLLTILIYNEFVKIAHYYILRLFMTFTYNLIRIHIKPIITCLTKMNFKILNTTFFHFNQHTRTPFRTP